MRVTGPNRNAGVSRSSKSGAKKRASGDFKLGDDDKTSSAGATQGTRSLTAVDALIALQEVPDATAEKSAQAIERAEDMLDVLEDIKLGLLSGSLPKSRLIRLAQLIEQRRADIDDPQLSGILDEIELRARVELAKLESAA